MRISASTKRVALILKSGMYLLHCSCWRCRKQYELLTCSCSNWGDTLRKKLTSTLFVAMMLSMTWANVPFASATTPPSTSLSISSAYNGTIVDNGFVYTSAAPNITLSVANPPNSTFYSTEYTIGVNGNITPYQGPFTLNLNYSSELELRYRSNGSSGLESWKSLTISC